MCALCWSTKGSKHLGSHNVHILCLLVGPWCLQKVGCPAQSSKFPPQDWHQSSHLVSSKMAKHSRIWGNKKAKSLLSKHTYRWTYTHTHTHTHPPTHCRGHLHKKNIVLNYKDRDGDLIQICDREDIELLKKDATAPKRSLGNCHAPWAIHVTLEGDYSAYNTALPGLPRR